MGRKHRYPVASLRAQKRNIIERHMNLDRSLRAAIVANPTASLELREEDFIEDFIEPIFRYGSATKVIIASSSFMRVFKNLSLRQLYKHQNRELRERILKLVGRAQ